MTEKLYYLDAYVREFTAEILSVTAIDDGYDIILDRTAFFPEEGGQSSDTGFISSANVIKVYEKDGVVHHITDSAPEETAVGCVVNFDDRFEKMQCHTAEHILCGIIHRLFGLNNVGFHLGDDEVAFDVDGVLSFSQLEEVEALANEAVFSNLKVDSFFPTTEELGYIEYRAKLDISEGVRLVKIGDVDTCACCAPHVSYTGEIGMIKILDFMKHRGGTRIWMVAGRRALSDYRARYSNIKAISGMLSAPQLQTASALKEYIKECEVAKTELKLKRLRIAEIYANQVAKTDSSKVFVFEDFSIPELIAFSNIANKKIGGLTVALAGRDGDYKYVISSTKVNLTSIVKDINSALCGRGGGRPEMIQGSFSATLDEIKSYLKT